jgi:hypothetical protein
MPIKSLDHSTWKLYICHMFRYQIARRWIVQRTTINQHLLVQFPQLHTLHQVNNKKGAITIPCKAFDICTGLCCECEQAGYTCVHNHLPRLHIHRMNDALHVKVGWYVRCLPWTHVHISAVSKADILCSQTCKQSVVQLFVNLTYCSANSLSHVSLTS